jgi:hypothetical protein
MRKSSELQSTSATSVAPVELSEGADGRSVLGTRAGRPHQHTDPAHNAEPYSYVEA